MWFAPIVPLLVFATLGPDAASAPVSAGPAAPQPIATRQTLFAIPFTIQEPQDASEEPVEVQLFVSADGGSSWHLYGKAEPAQRQFMFRAGADGEYWFQVRTLDRSGRLRPPSPAGPGLQVIVDTTPPKLQLSSEQGRAGQIITRWIIDEPRPRPESLVIQYRCGDDRQWQPVAIGPENRQVAGTVQTGQVNWWPQVSSGRIQICAEVTDAAGNPAVSHAQLALGKAAGPDAMATAGRPADAWRAGGEPPATRPPTQNATYPAAIPVTTAVNPPIRNQFVPPEDQAESPPVAQPAAEGLPPGERPHMINSRLFELEYEIEAVGPSGVNRVELWGTRDGGQTWRSFVLDNDNRSPRLVSVDKEGIYGFRVSVTSGAGLGGQPPKQGTLPEIFIGVDLTRPSAQITAIDQGIGKEAGNLVISWKADDRRLAQRSVSLFFSPTPGGPWNVIAAGLENTGRYAWPVDHRLPERLYLRLEVRDEAGNVGVFETAESISLDRHRPTVRIRNVRPLDAR